MMSSQLNFCNTDLLRERSNVTFSVDKLSACLFGGSDIIRRKKYIESLALNDSTFAGKDHVFMSRSDRYEDSVRKNVHAVSKIIEYNLSPQDMRFYFEVINPREYSPFGLHAVMFIPSIQSQGTSEQVAEWLPRALAMQVIGTYAQTELGHGTNIKMLETTATYDPSTQQFVLHSPTVSSTKWWPGNLGKTCNHAIVLAQVYSRGKYHGLHPFIVQIRSFKDHSPMPGVSVGDIGPKFGFVENDNGFLRFNHVCIPRENMLMKHAEVKPDGSFVRKASDRLVYGTMVFVRSQIVLGVARNLAMAATIVTRYSAVRKQSEIEPGKGEVQILDHLTHQYKVLPQIATTYALFFTARFMIDFYERTQKEIGQGDLDALPQLHALSSGLKALSSWQAAGGVEILRQACGGHGFSHASGLPDIYTDTVAACTYEGENVVMLLQTARYLVKCYSQVVQGKALPGFMSYLNADLGQTKLSDVKSLNGLVKLFKARSARMVRNAFDQMQAFIRNGHSSAQAWNMASIDLSKAAMAHCEAFVVQTFADKCEEPGIGADVRKVLQEMCLLYALYLCKEKFGDFVSCVTSRVQKEVDLQLYKMLGALRRNAVALVDTFQFHDRVLRSVLGQWDGNVYESMYKWAQDSQLNKTEVHPAYHKYMKGMMQKAQL